MLEDLESIKLARKARELINNIDKIDLSEFRPIPWNDKAWRKQFEIDCRAAEMGIRDLEHRSDLNLVWFYFRELLNIEFTGKLPLTSNVRMRLHHRGLLVKKGSHGTTRTALTDKCHNLIYELWYLDKKGEKK